MTKLAVEGLQAEREALLEVVKSLNDEEWNAPSDCAGWAVRDVLAHMGSVLHGVVDPAFMIDLSAGTEASMEAPVAQRRGWPIEEVVSEFEDASGQLVGFATMAQEPPMSETMLPMGDLGTHPMSMLPATFLFDLYCHLRNDILAPNGPIDRPEPPRDEKRLRPTVEWMLAGLPWMCAKELGFVDRPMTLALDGPGGGAWTIAPGGEDGRVLVTEGTAPGTVATATSSDHDFVVWGTQRRPWRGFVTLDGDTAYAARVLDAVDII